VVKYNNINNPPSILWDGWDEESHNAPDNKKMWAEYTQYTVISGGMVVW
jgi:hypothetical protein